MGKIPGRSAMSANKVGLMKMESARNAGWIPTSYSLLLCGNQNDDAIRTIPINHPSSVS